jgi:hypothetical protein
VWRVDVRSAQGKGEKLRVNFPLLAGDGLA